MASREVDYIAEVAGEVFMDSDTFLDAFSSSVTPRIHCNTMNPHWPPPSFSLRKELFVAPYHANMGWVLQKKDFGWRII